jgi:hypothetical protein
MRAPFETELEMARPNVREREERLQVEMVADQKRDNPEAARLSRQLLDLLQSTLDMAKRRLRDVELRSKR